jgi:hypothetical protein
MFFRFSLTLLLVMMVFYYAMVILHMMDVIKITERPYTWKMIIPFYYFKDIFRNIN